LEPSERATPAASLIADRYEVVRSLGRGSFAQTLLARDRAHARDVALKALHPRRAADWKSFDLFEREAAVLRSLEHSCVPAVYEVFRAPWDGSDAAFIAMEYIEGASFAEQIAERRILAPETLIGLLADMLGVLAYLHTRAPPVLHRDIKPANVIVRPNGAPVLVDFGAVRNILLGAEEDGSTVVGTYGYMPYEQMMGRATPASDLYALGATFLHLSTGRAPQEFLSDQGQLVVPLVLPGGAAFRATIARMLRAAPADRFSSAREALAALRATDAAPGGAVVAHEPEGTRVPGLWLELPPPGQRADVPIRELVAERAYRATQLLASGAPESRPLDAFGLLTVGLLSVLTLGVFPGVFWMMARGRREQLRHFFTHGTLATARIHRIDWETSSVGYSFEVDGTVLHATDTVPSAAASGWDVGMLIQVLHLPGENHLSVVVSV
jgi:hypothetical protein